MRKLYWAPAGAVLLSILGPALAAPPAWRISEVAGDVQLVEDGQTRRALRGALLASGATITTGPSARAVIVRGKEFVVISPRSRLRVPTEPESGGGLVQMITDLGSSLFKIEKKSTPHFSVKTPFLAAVVKGTTFSVTVGPEGGSVQVTEGAVEVSTLDGGAAEILRPGSVASIGASDLFQLTIQGDVSKVVRSGAAGPAASPEAGTERPVLMPVLKIAAMDAVIAEESSTLPMVRSESLEQESPVTMLLAELGSDSVDAAQTIGSPRTASAAAPDDDRAPAPATGDLEGAAVQPPADDASTPLPPPLSDGDGSGGAPSENAIPVPPGSPASVPIDETPPADGGDGEGEGRDHGGHQGGGHGNVDNEPGTVDTNTSTNTDTDTDTDTDNDDDDGGLGEGGGEGGLDNDGDDDDDRWGDDDDDTHGDDGDRDDGDGDRDGDRDEDRDADSGDGGGRDDEEGDRGGRSGADDDRHDDEGDGEDGRGDRDGDHGDKGPDGDGKRDD